MPRDDLLHLSQPVTHRLRAVDQVRPEERSDQQPRLADAGGFRRHFRIAHRDQGACHVAGLRLFSERAERSLQFGLRHRRHQVTRHLDRVADCDQPHLWTLVSENDVSQGKDEKYPGNDQVQSRAEQMCIEEKPDSVTGWFWISPSPDEWKAGKRTSFCFWASVPVTSA